jgi:type II secretory pathway pseudopilin PulG
MVSFLRASMRRARGQDGMTLAELLVAMFVMGNAVMIFTSVLSSVQRGVVAQENLNRTLEDARPRSSSSTGRSVPGTLYDPALENNRQLVGCDSGYTPRVATQSNALTRAVTRASCGRSTTRSACSPAAGRRTCPTPRRPGGVATGVVNKSVGEPAFALDADPLKGGRTLDITLALNEDLEGRPGQTARIRAALTGRNTSYDYPINVCATTPT